MRSTVKITTHVLYSILVIHGEILRIVVYRKFRQLRAFVEFSKEEFATKVIDESNHIVLDYITLKAEYGKPSSVIVKKNDELSWDYSKSPLLKYVNGLPTLKSIVAILKDSPQKNRNIAENDKTWELVENYDFIKPDDKPIAPGKSSTKQIITTANSKTRKTLLVIPISEEFSILSVRGLDPAKSNCNRLFRLLSMYATVAKIDYLPELKSAEVHISKCNDINIFAQVQQHYLSHGFNLSFQYLKAEWILKKPSIDPFILPDGSPSHVVYDRKMKPHVLCPPSRVLQFEGAPPSMNEMKLIALLKRTIKIEDFKVKVTTPKDSKNCSTISGEMWFSSASVAIEVVMEINYAIFWNKDSNKKKHVLKLSFISEVLPILEVVVPKKENNKAIKIEDNKAIKTEDFEAIENEENKMIKTEDFKAIKNENNKRIKTEDFEAIENEENKIIKTENFKAIENENNKRIKTEDFEAIENEENKIIKTEDFEAIENEYNKRIKTEDFEAIENEENKIIKTEDFEAIENEYNKRIKTEDFEAIENENNKRIKTEDFEAIENKENKIIKTEDFKAIENEYNKRIKTEDFEAIEYEENKIIKTEDFKAIENEYNKIIKTEDFKVIENENNKIIKTESIDAIIMEDNNAIKTEYCIVIKTEVD
ncbi:heterogeneous nuclear ribonucleoprotein L-like isoform X2 [Aphis gossypii]|nr:heterogeneous nuclear ribonucleoprotein L-like isoform X2 [Aphis gossypii]